jgi:glycosyltransferase involved in cell wall biosynthesis
MPKNLIAVFFYNNKKTVGSVLLGLKKLDLKNTYFLLINDASIDNTLFEIHKYKKKIKNSIFINNSINRGFARNYKFSIKYAIKNSFDKLVFFHGDKQYPLNKINLLINKLNHYDLCYGSRFLNRDSVKQNMPRLRYFANKFLTYYLNFLFKAKVTEYFSGFRGFKVESLLNINLKKFSNFYEIEQQIHFYFIKKKKNISEFSIPTRYYTKHSSIPPFKYCLRIIVTGLFFALFI